MVFEWWSPRNDFPHQVGKLRFYERYGVREFYTFDQVRQQFAAFRREADQLVPVSTEEGITSELLGIRMSLVDGELKAWHPDGRPFLTMTELEEARVKAEEERDRAVANVAQLRARLLALGIDPDAV